MTSWQPSTPARSTTSVPLTCNCATLRLVGFGEKSRECSVRRATPIPSRATWCGIRRTARRDTCRSAGSLRARPTYCSALRPCWAMSPLLVSRDAACRVVCSTSSSSTRPARSCRTTRSPRSSGAGRIVVAGDDRQLPPTDVLPPSAGRGGGRRRRGGQCWRPQGLRIDPGIGSAVCLTQRHTLQLALSQPRRTADPVLQQRDLRPPTGHVPRSSGGEPDAASMWWTVGLSQARMAAACRSGQGHRAGS